MQENSQFQNWELHMQRDEDSKRKYTMYQSSKLLIGEGREEVLCFRKQEGMDDWVATRSQQVTVRTETSIEVRTERVRAQQASRN